MNISVTRYVIGFTLSLIANKALGYNNDWVLIVMAVFIGLLCAFDNGWVERK
jgi:hypothetical protein